MNSKTFSKIRSKTVILGLMALLFASPLFAFAPASYAATDSYGCPTNAVLHFAMYGGVPSNLNLLGSYNPSGYNLAFLMYPYGISPAPYPNGSADMQVSASDYITHNANYTVWTFNAKPGLKWSNGQPINASTFLQNFGPSFSFNASVDPIGAYQYVTKEYAANTTEAVYVLNQSQAHFDELIAPTVNTALYPPSFIAQGPTYSGINNTLVTSGPFYLASYSLGSTSAVLLRNPYFNPKPGICEVDVNFVEAESQTPTSLLSGAADFAQIDSSVASDIAATGHFTIIPGLSGGGGLEDIQYNITSYPYNQLGFRQALLYAINQTDLAQNAFYGYGTPAYNMQGFVPNVTAQWYNPNQVSNYSYNPTKALSILHGLGYTTDSSGNLHYPNGTRVILQMNYQLAYTETTLSATIVQNDLEKVGITLTVEGTTNSQMHHLEHVPGGEDHMLWLTWSGGGIFGSAYWDSLPSCYVYNTEWECPITPTGSATGNAYTGNVMGNDTANNEYWSNVTAISLTTNPTTLKQSLDNIQVLRSQYLPELNVQIGTYIWAINNQKFTNFGPMISGGIAYFGQNYNPDGFAAILPVGTSTSSSSTGTGGSGSSTVTSTSTTVSTSTNTQGSTSSSSSSTQGSSTLLYVAIAVVIIVVIGAIAGILFSRRRSPATAQ
jgi:ABC-type transport system substrate-binding protein